MRKWVAGFLSEATTTGSLFARVKLAPINFRSG